MTDYAITAADVLGAARTLHGKVLKTPLLPAPRLSELSGATVLIKYENMQPTGSFKERGAYNKLVSLSADERRRGVIAMSAGNHAQAVAYIARQFGIPATIVMPVVTPILKAENTRSYGAEVILHGETLAESALMAQKTAKERGLTLIHPYDDPLVMAGQGTLALEILEDAPDVDCIVVPIGGGGLISGIAIAAKAKNPKIDIFGVEADFYPSCTNALEGSTLPIGGPTLAEGIAVKTIGEHTLPIIRDLVSKVFLVGEQQIETAINHYATLQRTMAEGAAAAGLATLLAHPETFRGRKVTLVLSGGNIDARILASIMVRELERANRIISLRITTNDVPCLLGQLAGRLGELGANILEVSHRRLFLDVPVKGVSIDFTIEARDANHAATILTALEKDGLSPHLLSSLGTAYQG